MTIKRYELDDNSSICVIATIIAMAVLGITYVLTDHYTQRTEAAIKAGLHQSTLPGSQGTAWVRPPQK